MLSTNNEKLVRLCVLVTEIQKMSVFTIAFVSFSELLITIPGHTSYPLHGDMMFLGHLYRYTDNH
jgi:hypothetical protein